MDTDPEEVESYFGRLDQLLAEDSIRPKASSSTKNERATAELASYRRNRDSEPIADVEAFLKEKSLEQIAGWRKPEWLSMFYNICSSDFTMEYSLPSGGILEMGADKYAQFAESMKAISSWKHTTVDVLDVVVQSDPNLDYATVWVTSLIRDSKDGSRRERIVAYSWRKDKIIKGEAESGEQGGDVRRWVLWKQAISAWIPSVPF